jgi:flagellar biosynthetic protein FlhB
MSEDFADRTQAATPRRREQFRREGKVARSADLTSAIITIGCLLLLISAAGAALASTIESLLKSSFTLCTSAAPPQTLFDSAAKSTLTALAPILLTVFLLAIIATLTQTGRPNLFHRPPRRLGFQRAGHINFFSGLLKLLILAWITTELIRSRLPELLSLDSSDFRQFLTSSSHLLFSILLRITLVLLAFGAIDYTIQRLRLERQLKMTRRELTEEIRQTEGDPKIRARRRQLAVSWSKSLKTRA